MKKIFNIAALIATIALAQACDPMKDTYAELDINKIDRAGVREMTLELTDADYSTFKKSSGYTEKNKAFSSEDSAKILIPELLNSKYKYLEETSTINVTYNLNNVNTKMNPTVGHTLTMADYLAVNGATNGQPSVPKFTTLNSASSIIKAAEAINKTPKNGDVLQLTFAWNSKPVKDSTATVLYFDGAWAIAYTLLATDYTIMTQANSNFSSAAVANTFIPIFIANKFPYSVVEGSIQPVLYTMYNGTGNPTTTEVCLLKYVSGKWIVINGTVKYASKFAVKSGKWVPDNTIKHKLITDDYKITIAGLSKTELPTASENIAKYGNFDMRYWNDQQIEKYLGLFAGVRFPDAITDQKCELTYVTFSPSATLVKVFVKNAEGKFEIIK
ncbi:hypothetical protein Pedsa_0441 [Pseudopedobacter saltans DSM 12145]|uniref:DUF5017 domain-containing protein n=1 Tax=Pseudopedobacter saltans (strain ATCC 51119 / DSM 12145 / JCM 21818 / CCUG 39354 / LMG 10337 / NBRC 100064 / NCIMB 13643) TaxID=762903 RepID=F0S5V2_PSESL|nr:hypothetical protein [Pseudopedobacter saltans]ADY51023.1 hypothetical protein Pedsa_0441 [Pseudopedobacter saltans DSM 12145]